MGPEMTVFQVAKQPLAGTCHLVHLLPKEKLSLMVESLADQIGDAMQQWSSPSALWRPLVLLREIGTKVKAPWGSLVPSATGSLPPVAARAAVLDNCKSS